MELSVVGLGKLGLCTAAYFASKEHRVIGVDKDDHLVGEIGRKRCPVKETGLAELLETVWDNFSVTTDLGDAVRRSDITLAEPTALFPTSMSRLHCAGSPRRLRLRTDFT